MSKVSIIIPSRNEKYLKNTIEDVLKNATGDIEILVGLDGQSTYPLLTHQKVKYLLNLEPIGLKAMINQLAAAANGKYIYKSDSHCSFGKGFDEILQKDMQENWVVTPRLMVLNAETWKPQDERFYDYFYLVCPFTDPKGIRFKAGGHWPERTKERLNILIDETPQMHGSGWFMDANYFRTVIGGFPTNDPMGHAQEPPYLGLKSWLGKGDSALMVNKNTWYAHLHQQGNKRGYPEDRAHTERTYREVADYWLQNKWEDRLHDFDWFVEKFYPMPTWPENWRQLYEQYLTTYSK